MKLLVTGVAGFIGKEVGERLLQEGKEVVGVDNLNKYYDVRLKEYRLKLLHSYSNFKFYHIDIENSPSLDTLFSSHSFDAVINLAARAGVRYSIQNPYPYFTTNVIGTLNLLELCRKYKTPTFLLASTSSLYAGEKLPFKEDLPLNTPISPYAASKKGAEAVGYSYYHLYQINVIILRYFTVYGPIGRPDMSVFRFIKWVMEGKEVEVFGDGTQQRDFTYIDDIVEGTIKALKTVKGFEVINLGNNHPHKLNEMLELVERFTNKKVTRSYKEFHKADLLATWADITKAKKLLKWEPKVTLERGIESTVKWFEDNWQWVKKIRL